jgi:hypothetical protein
LIYRDGHAGIGDSRRRHIIEIIGQRQALFGRHNRPLGHAAEGRFAA